MATAVSSSSKYLITSSMAVSYTHLGYEPTIQLTSEEVTIPSYAELDKSYIDIEATSNVAFEVVAPEDLDWLTLEGESKRCV